MFRKYTTFLFLFCASTCFAQQIDLNTAIPIDAKIRTGKLPNGLTYYLYKNNLPEKRAELRLVLKAGSLFETDEEQGLAHFTEHLCFNGTKRFPKDSLIKFIESAGMKFGAHLNASTGFEETIYQLSLPTDKPETLEKGLKVLEDWSHQVSFESIEIEKERGVVISEQRDRLGAGERMRKQWFPILYKDSRYVERLPIGQLSVLENFKPETLRQFYQKWYRPNLMAICVVGDIDLEETEQKIKMQFSLLQNPSDAPAYKQYGIPDHNGLRVVIASDEEATQSSISLYYKLPHEPIATGNDYYRQLNQSMFNMMMNSRFGDIILKGNAPFTYASSARSNWENDKDAFVSSVGMKETETLQALNAVLTENQRVRQYGFSKEELQRAKTNFLSAVERTYKERDKVYSRGIINQLVHLFTNNSPFPDADFNYQICKKYLAETNLDDINQLAKQWITARGDNATLILMMPKKEGLTPPNEADLRQVFEEVASAKIEPWKEEAVSSFLMEKSPDEGEIRKEKYNKTYDYTEWKLSNGIKVLWKATDFRNDQVLFSAFSEGGYAMYPVSDDDNGAFAATIIGSSGVADFDQLALKRILSGKNFSLSPYISERNEGFRGSFINKDAEIFFQMLYLLCTAPRKDESLANTILQQRKISITNRSKSPESNFRDSINTFYFGNNPRRKPSQVADLEKVSLDRMFEIYKDRFANMGDFTFVFVGNIEPNSFRDFVKTYLASLPTIGRKEKESDPDVHENIQPVAKTVYAGKELRVLVEMRYNALGRTKKDVPLQLAALNDVIEKRLREVLREEKGATYNVGVSAYTDDFPKGEEKTVLNISFSCAPDKMQEMISATEAELKNIAQNGVNPQDLLNVQENYIRSRETSKKENSFWLGALSAAAEDRRSMKRMTSYEARVKKLSPKTLQQLLQKILAKGIKMQFVLMPKDK